MNTTLTIEARPGLDQDICKFILSQTIYPGQKSLTFLIEEKASYSDSPLISNLFSTPLDQSLIQINIKGSEITLRKRSDSQNTWREIGPIVGKKIREVITPLQDKFRDLQTKTIMVLSGEESGLSDKYFHEEMKEMQAKAARLKGETLDGEFISRHTVETLLEEVINPGVASHGGKISLVGIKGYDVYLKMGGGCQGCGMASVTLKQGIEGTLKKHIPEIQNVIDTTDHSTGENPFY